MLHGLPIVTTPSNDYSETIYPGLNGFVSVNFDESLKTLLIHTENLLMRIKYLLKLHKHALAYMATSIK